MARSEILKILYSQMEVPQMGDFIFCKKIICMYGKSKNVFYICQYYQYVGHNER